MSEAHGHPVSDAVESDPAALNSAEDLDEDRLRQERPDVQPEDPDRPLVATTPAEQLDASVDDEAGEKDTLVSEDAEGVDTPPLR